MRILCSMTLGVKLFFLSVFTLVSCSSQMQVYTLSGRTMGTNYVVKIVSSKKIKKAELKKQIDKRLLDFNQLMSTYIKNSEISLFNGNKSLAPIKVSPLFMETVLVARDIYHKSKTLYDVTISPLVNRWHFGPYKKKNWKVPSADEIKKIKNCIGFKKLDILKNSIRKKHLCLGLDFSSLAKGQGVDLISDYLLKTGLENHMVEIGGEVKVRGEKKGKPWRVGIESPKLDHHLSSIINLKSGECLATSGGYRNYFFHKGKKYSHTLNPETGFPVTHNLASVTVKLKSCMRADAWATAFMVMGSEKAFKLAQKEGIWASFMVEDNGQYQVFNTDYKNKSIKGN